MADARIGMLHNIRRDQTARLLRGPLRASTWGTLWGRRWLPSGCALLLFFPTSIQYFPGHRQQSLTEVVT